MTRDILDAAEALFLRLGCGVSLQAVADAARVSRTALYARFPSKEALLVATVERLVEGWSTQSRLSRREAALPLDERLRLSAVRTLRIMGTGKAQQLERLVQSQASRSPALRLLVAELGFGRGVGNFARVLADGDMAADDPRTRRAAMAFVQMLVGWMATADSRAARGRAAQDEAARYFVGILLSGRDAW